jgi:hypothetical protein
MAIVYLHRRKDTNEVFYIGIGKDSYRIGRKANRNKYWHNIVNKYGYTKELLFKDITWEEAIKKEIELINKYGRKDLKTGCLVNMTRGGEGCPSNEIAYPDYYTKEELRDLIMKIHPRNF